MFSTDRISFDDLSASVNRRFDDLSASVNRRFDQVRADIRELRADHVRFDERLRALEFADAPATPRPVPAAGR